ncbi:TBC1 domain family member 16-like isoform X2 [Haliotis cracherodii]|uniref:TBC1 domain family member 16-like isoform X2 n=1 Tax=Haliotis cracherodii TaxID=6455 RepID=UPI0039E908AF
MEIGTFPAMAFSNIFKKATSLLGIGGDALKPPPLDGEIIYCKNNVCVHPPAPLSLDAEHYPGYLTLRAHEDKACGPTLILTWIPNATLKKNPRSIENSPNKSKGNTPRASPRRTPKQEFAKLDHGSQLTPSPSESQCDSGILGGSDIFERLERSLPRRKKHSTDNTSLSSEISVGSRDDSVESWNPSEEFTRDGHRLSTSNKSQTDSGIGPEEIMTSQGYVQNNEKSLPIGTKPNKVGINVNDLHTEKGKSNMEQRNLMNTTVKEEELSSPDSDGLTSEEQLAAMLKRNKLHTKARERTDSNKSVSIEMDGDKLVVVTEEVGDDAFVDKNTDLSERNLNKNESKFDMSSSPSTDVDSASLSSDSTHPSPSGAHYDTMLSDLKKDLESQNGLRSGEYPSKEYPLKEYPPKETVQVMPTASKTPNELDLSGFTHPPPNTPILTPDISVTRCRNTSSSSTTTSGPDSRPPSPYTSDDSAPNSPGKEYSSSSSSASVSHNLTFPENSVAYSSNRKDKKSAKEQICGVFSVDLGQMRSLRLFYSDKECTRGQVVIASRESQYKILHFHNGGLDKLAEIFEDWSLFAKAKDKVKEGETPYRQFLIVKPQITDDQCHPEEGVYATVTEEIWRVHMNREGIIEDDYQLRKAIFFGGLDPLLRHESWPYLLHYFPYDSSFDEREQIRNDKFIEYQNIRKMRESMTFEEQQQFWRMIQCTVEKDVVRTDRSHPYFRGDDNPNIEVLKNILLNYAVANPWMGYTQGMSDLLAPVLAEVQNEVDAYWCFVGLMQRTIFVSSPRDSDMDKQLNYFRELLRLMEFKFFSHLVKLGSDAMELLFCHRWILLCFKREFPECDALRIWEACWSHYQTDYFHLFLCVAIVSIYGDDVIEQNLPADEILLHFSSLAMHMNGDLVLRKARGLLHQYRKMRKIPCTLFGLCSRCSPGMWDSGHVPTVECVGHREGDECLYQSQPSTPVTPTH